MFKNILTISLLVGVLGIGLILYNVPSGSIEYSPKQKIISNSGSSSIMNLETLELGNWGQRFSLFESGSQEMNIKAGEFKKNWSPIQAQWIENTLSMSGYIIIQESLSGNSLRYIVSQKGKALYTSEPTAFLASSPFQRFSVEGNNWWFLYSKNIIDESDPYRPTAQQQYILVKNGERIPAQEAFGLTEFSERIFYFFRSKTGDTLSYFFDGKTYETPFDEIIHDQCCMAAMQNISTSTDGRLTFWAKKGEKLTYNTATISTK